VCYKTTRRPEIFATQVGICYYLFTKLISGQNNVTSPGRKRSTIRTVAQHTNLSPTTVSLALRGDESISPPTRERVIKAARELGYVYTPRPARNKKTEVKTLAYIVKDYGDQPATSNPFYGSILNGIQQTSLEYEFSLRFVLMEHEAWRNNNFSSILSEKPDGIIMASPYSRQMVDLVAGIGDCPVVLVDNTFPVSPYDIVMADDFGSGYQITQHLLNLGHRRIKTVMGFALSPHVPPSFRERYRGYCAACMDHGVDSMPEAVGVAVIDDPANPDRDSLFQEWLQAIIADEPDITAFFGVSDLYAVRVMKALQNLNYHVPGDFSVAGCDDYELANVIKPSLTTVRLYPRIMGQVAVRQIFARIAGDTLPPLHLTIGADLIPRESTGAAR
jgi:LacI family transcriptional regulator